MKPHPAELDFVYMQLSRSTQRTRRPPPRSRESSRIARCPFLVYINSTSAAGMYS